MGDTVNILSFDIEEWFHPEIFAGRYPISEWERLESRVRRNTDIILEFLVRKKLTATFFILGWVAERFPDIVRDTASAGHEIASHGYSHQMVTKMSPEEFRADLRRSLDILNALSPEPVVGFRAPTFSITDDSRWALPIMYEEGIRFDSSVFPIHHDRYGIPDAPRDPYPIYRNGTDVIYEYPMTTVRVGSLNLPCSGGGYFRLYPFQLSLHLMKRCAREGRPIIFYAHPWEFDTGMPHVDLGVVSRIRHYANIDKFLKRLDTVTGMFPFAAFRDAAPVAFQS